MRNYFTFAGRESREFGLYINGHKTFDSPEKNVSTYVVPGRSGDIVEDDRTFKNVELQYNSSFMFENFDENFSNLKNFLLSKSGYQRLTDTYHPDEFRKAIFRKAIQPTMNESNEVGAFDLVFECQPQRFLISGEQEIEITEYGANIVNPTLFNSKPLLKVYGKGEIEINNYSFEIIDFDEFTEIDCESLDCHQGNINRNENVIFTGYKFPELTPGNNYFIFDQTITKIIVTPRWFRL